MNDQLEDFIRNNRKEFDDKEPSGKVWAGVEKSLHLSRTSWWDSVVLWRAAAVVFFVLSVSLLIPRAQQREQNSLVLKEFTDVEAYYVKEISEKVELIDGFQHNEGLNGFTRDFQQMEAMYLVLKEEMKNHPSRKVSDALILNLLVRIDLLNQQLNKLEKEYRPKSKRENEVKTSA